MKNAPKTACDVLNLEACSSGRDIDIVEPVLSYLELRYGLRVVRESYLRFEPMFFKYRPRLCIISNGVGTPESARVVKFASRVGIDVITLISEGDYKEDDVEEFFWGWNKERVFHEDLHLEWSQRNLDLIHRYIPESAHFNIRVSGATGFDRYKILSCTQKETLLSRYKKESYKKVIGIAGWGFDLILGSYFEKFRVKMEKLCGKEHIELHRRSKEVLRHIYRKLIGNNRDILFILRYHPTLAQEEFTEFYELDAYENTLVVKGTGEDIADIINASDLWIAYDSSTCLEAWMLKKQTMLINPLGGDFKRSMIYRGSPVKTSYAQAQNAIDTFYKTQAIPGFDEREHERKRIIHEVITWDDGKNHMRAGDYIYRELINSRKKQRYLNTFVVANLLEALLKKVIFDSRLTAWIPMTGSWDRRRISSYRFDHTEREEEHRKYLSNLKKFYEKNHILS